MEPSIKSIVNGVDMLGVREGVAESLINARTSLATTPQSKCGNDRPSLLPANGVLHFHARAQECSQNMKSCLVIRWNRNNLQNLNN